MVAAQPILVIVENGSPLESGNGEAVVPWWSFTKTVIAAAALRLVQRGTLGLDDPIDGRPFTLRQVLQHRAGLADYAGLPAYREAVERGEEPWPPSVLLERLEPASPRVVTGTDWAYSNVSYLLVRRCIEAACNRDFGSALEHLVLQPLGIEATRLATTTAQIPARTRGLARGYHPGWVYHGLLVGPLREAALLLDRLFAGALLSPELLRDMRERYVLPGPIEGRPWRSPGYGLGLMSGLSTCGARAEGHTGNGPSSVIAVYHSPDASPPATAAAFLEGADEAAVETAAMLRRPI